MLYELRLRSVAARSLSFASRVGVIRLRVITVFPQGHGPSHLLPGYCTVLSDYSTILQNTASIL